MYCTFQVFCLSPICTRKFRVRCFRFRSFCDASQALFLAAGVSRWSSARDVTSRFPPISSSWRPKITCTTYTASAAPAARRYSVLASTSACATSSCSVRRTTRSHLLCPHHHLLLLLLLLTSCAHRVTSWISTHHQQWVTIIIIITVWTCCLVDCHHPWRQLVD